MSACELIPPQSFESERHFYPRVPNARLHPTVRAFLAMGNERLALRYQHLHPEVSHDGIRDLLGYRARWFRWIGGDLLLVADDSGRRHSVVVETNSCPSGQKSMPLRDEHDDHGGYRTLLEQAFLPALRSRRLPSGSLAVLCDKNPMETKGYAATLAEVTGEPVLWVHLPDVDWEAVIEFRDGVLHVHHGGAWVPVRAAFRYVTNRPWAKIPVSTRTFIFNPVIACLAGGRNKLVASKAYDLFNSQQESTGLHVDTPETIWDVSLPEVPLWVGRMGGIAVVKDPYSNAGQGVWTITTPAELDAFMAAPHPYDRFIVQALIGNHNWTSRGVGTPLYHVGMVPNLRGKIYVADLRCMIGNGPDGYFPVAFYARRARAPLSTHLSDEFSSWDMLGTNLSVKREDGSWTTEPERLLLADERDFNKLGIGPDDLAEVYVQTCMAALAIDQMCGKLLNTKGHFRKRLFASLVPDPSLLAEIRG